MPAALNMMDAAKESPLKAFEMEVNIGPDGAIHVPADVAAQIPRNQQVKAILLIPDGDPAWQVASSKAFLEGYGPDDSIYDKA